MFVYVRSGASIWKTGLGEGNNLIANNVFVSVCVYVFMCVRWANCFGEGNNRIANNMYVYEYMFSCVSYVETGFVEGNNLIENNVGVSVCVCVFMYVRLGSWFR